MKENNRHFSEKKAGRPFQSLLGTNLTRDSGQNAACFALHAVLTVFPAPVTLGVCVGVLIMPRVASDNATVKASPHTKAPRASQVNHDVLDAAEDTVCPEMEHLPGVDKSIFHEARDIALERVLHGNADEDVCRPASVHSEPEAFQPSGSPTHSGTREDHPTETSSSHSGWMAAKLCTQCSEINQRATGKGWCNALQCAFIRGFVTVCDLLNILAPLTVQLLCDQVRSTSPHTQHILALSVETEEIATGLLWQMSGIIRWVCNGAFL